MMVRLIAALLAGVATGCDMEQNSDDMLALERSQMREKIVVVQYPQYRTTCFVYIQTISCVPMRAVTPEKP